MSSSSSRKTVTSDATSTNKTRKNKFGTELCDSKMTFQECEMAILRNAVDEMDTKRGEKTANSPDVVKMIKIVEEFLMDKKLICYGGTAINNILPKHAQFYNKNIEIPDYDFFSPTALEHAKELADIFYKRGYDEVEAKAGVHQGTYKVFVNFIPVADITFLHHTLYASLHRDAINIGGIRYAPANYLRMGMFLELSRPEGDISRWEKVLKRLNLLNKYHPLYAKGKCSGDVFQSSRNTHKPLPEKMFFATRDCLIDQGVVFFGGYAASLYARYMPDTNQRMSVNRVPYFDVLAESPDRCANVLKDILHENRIRHVKLIQHTSIGEVVPDHIEVVAENTTIAYIYRPISCHSYNTIMINKREVHIATIDTMLSFYLAFLYADKKYYDKTRILCMSAYLFQVEQHNRLAQKGVLKRFSAKCYGKQETLEDMRSEKAQLFKDLSKKRKSPEYEKAFLKYEPKNNTQLKRDTKLTEEPAELKTHVITETGEDSTDNEPKTEPPKPTGRQTRRYSPKRPRMFRKQTYRKSTVYKAPRNSVAQKTTPQTNEPPVEDNPDTPYRRRAKSSWMSRFSEEDENTSNGQFLF